MPIQIALPSPKSPATSTAPHNITSPDAFLPVTSQDLDKWLNDPGTLILDIRTSGPYCSARVPGAVSISAPSTLLKRPSYSLRDLSKMLSPRSAKRFLSWPSAKRILVYDADSVAIPENSTVYGLLRKFQNDNFKGQLAWLRGGFHSVWRERRELVDANPPTPDAEDDDVVAESSFLGQPSVLRPRLLATQAFNVSSTVQNNPPASRRGPLRLKNPQPSTSSNHHQAVNPFFDTIRQNVELSHGITERIPLQLPHRVRRRLDDLQSLPWLQRIAKRAGKSSPRSHPQSSDPSSDDSTDGASLGDSYANALATQFYEIELAEQRRLMGIMQHHSKESGVVLETSCSSSSTSAVFPFSITAGVEKGAKNRYRHIWPFEHARVKLHQKDDDYVNASYVQPLFTSKRYIATQGPLPATYRDFWTLCWEQNVHVIVMLTREVEGVMVKCGSYWSDHEYGPLRLRLLSTTGLPKETVEEPSGFFSAHASYPARPRTQAPSTNAPQKPQHFRKEETVKRVFELTHTGFPEAKPRTIVHLQYLDWPDMNVPDDPRGVLGLIKQVEEAVAETTKRDEALPIPESGDIDSRTGIETQALKGDAPLLLHCSAGVGRTGGFIAVDAILDAIRREVREKGRSESLGGSMDVQYDGSGSGPPPPSMDDPSMDMQVDGSEDVSTAQVKSQADNSAPSFAPPYRDTQQWAEKVGEETRYGENDQHGTDAVHAQEVAPLSSVDSISAVSRSSSSDGSSLERDTPSSVEVQGSSSLGTSISSGTRPSLHGKMGLGARHRERTSSAPAPTATIKSTLRRIGVPPSLNLGLGQMQPAAASSTPAFSNVPTAPHSMSPATSVAPLPPPSSSTQRHFLDSAPRSPTNSPPQEPAGVPKRDLSTDPRPLHSSGTPLPLRSSKDPIWDVIKDMREQRMSLCQSLRQYVFVHMAVIEGALMVLDEERDLAMGKVTDAFESTIDPTRLRDRLVQPKTAPSRMAAGQGYRVPHSRSSSVSSRRYTPHHSNQNSPSRRRSKGSSSRRQSPSPSESVSTRAAGFPIPPLMFQQALSIESAQAASSGAAAVAASHGKRSASPTELTKEGMQGQVLLSKRPSMKRKRGAERGSDDTEPSGGEFGLNSSAAAVTPSAA